MIEYLKKHHAITEQAIGSIHVLLKKGKYENALMEVEIAIHNLGEAESTTMTNKQEQTSRANEEIEMKHDVLEQQRKYEPEHGQSGPKGEQQRVVMREPAPANSLPDWAECMQRVENSAYVAEGGFVFEEDGHYANEIHRFIYEYDDADPYRSAWFLHRLEKLIEFVKADAQQEWTRAERPAL